MSRGVRFERFFIGEHVIGSYPYTARSIVCYCHILGISTALMDGFRMLIQLFVLEKRFLQLFQMFFCCCCCCCFTASV